MGGSLYRWLSLIEVFCGDEECALRGALLKHTISSDVPYPRL